MPKGKRKTVRLSDEMLEYIESQPGDQFTEKLESLIWKQKLETSVREKEIQRLEEKINEANKTINDFREIQAEVNKLADRLKAYADRLLPN